MDKLRLSRCKICDGKVSRTASECPHCGDNNPIGSERFENELENLYKIIKDINIDALSPLLSDRGEFDNGFVFNTKCGEVIIQKVSDSKIIVILDGTDIHEEYVYTDNYNVTDSFMLWYDEIIGNSDFDDRFTKERERKSVLKIEKLSDFFK